MTSSPKSATIHHMQHHIVEFTIKVRMIPKWVPHFLAMLRQMQYLGAIGSSKWVSIMSDGDGDFRPTFEWANSLPEIADPRKSEDDEVRFDTG